MLLQAISSYDDVPRTAELVPAQLPLFVLPLLTNDRCEVSDKIWPENKFMSSREINWQECGSVKSNYFYKHYPHFHKIRACLSFVYLVYVMSSIFFQGLIYVLVMSSVCSVCHVQRLLCQLFIVSIDCYVQSLLCLVSVCLVFVVSRTCLSRVGCLVFVMSSAYLSRVGYSTTLILINRSHSLKLYKIILD